MDEQVLLITVPEAARRLEIGKSKAWAMAQAGELPGVVRVGQRSVRVSEKALERWVAANAVAA